MTTFTRRAHHSTADASEPTEAADRNRGRRHDHGVHGIILAGSYRWGGTAFDRLLRGPLVPVALTPVVRYPLAWLRDAGVGGAVICANSGTSAVRGALGDGRSSGIRLEYFEDTTPRGPAGCAADAARDAIAHTFVVVEGALIPSLDLRGLLAAHVASGAAATVVVEVDRRRRTLMPAGQRLPGGVYVLDRRVLEQVPARGYHDIKEGLLERLYADRERVRTFEVQGVSPRVLDFATYTSVSQWLIGRAVAEPSRLPGYARDTDSARHPSAVVHPDARLVGPVVLGASVRIEAGAVVVGPTAVGPGSRIMRDAVVTRSNLWSGCTIGAGAVVDASLVADGGEVEPGAQLEWELVVGAGVASPSADEPAPALVSRSVERPAPTGERRSEVARGAPVTRGADERAREKVGA